MKNYTFCIIAFVFMLAFVFEPQATTILIDPVAQEIPSVGGTLSVGVKVEGVTDLFAYQSELSFDKTALSFSAIQEEKFLGEDGAATFPFLTLNGRMVSFKDITPAVVVDINSAGVLMVANTRLGSTKGVNGTSRLVTITFEVLKAKASTLELKNVVLADSNARPITTNVVGGSITFAPKLPPVIREHSTGSPILALQATYNKANVHGHTYIDIWKGSKPIEAGQFLEFQVAMFSGNPTFRGTVDLHTTDGATLRDSGARDQNGISAHPSADLSKYARDQWYHRKISLDALAGKTLDGVMIATDSDEHRAGMFRIYVDNIQITNGEYILTSIYIDEDTIPITGTSTATGTTLAGTQGMSDYSVSIVGATPVAPEGKSVSSWGKIKSR